MGIFYLNCEYRVINTASISELNKQIRTTLHNYLCLQRLCLGFARKDLKIKRLCI